MFISEMSVTKFTCKKLMAAQELKAHAVKSKSEHFVHSVEVHCVRNVLLCTRQGLNTSWQTCGSKGCSFLAVAARVRSVKVFGLPASHTGKCQRAEEFRFGDCGAL
jgi:hypothetical protein